MTPRRTVAAGVVTALVAAVLFVAIAVAVHSGSALTLWDQRVADALHRNVGPPWTDLLAAVSALHAPRAILALTAVAALPLLARRDAAGLLMLLASVIGGSSLNHLLKHSFQRARPNFEGALVTVSDFSFPSGHVASATLLYGAVAVLIMLATPRRRIWLAAAASAAALVALVALSRVALGKHYLSDAVAAAAFGVAWLAICGTVLALYRQRRLAR